MLFPTITFAVFFLIVYTINWLLMPRPVVWKLVMIAAGVVFYGWWDWRFVLLLAAAALGNQALGVRIYRQRLRDGGRTRFWIVLAVVLNLLVLGVFKYFDFFAVNLDFVLHRIGLGEPLPLLQLILPVGISFLIFRMLTYVIDIGRGQLVPATLLDFSVYVTFFPYLLAGPITRAGEFLPQLGERHDPRDVATSPAFVLILGGLAKKMLIADYLSSHIVNGVFGSPESMSAWETLWGILAYSVQIYCDFSAYSDIAIGVALLLGFRLPENFRAPYTARTLQDFWRRWHISLSTWLRDYLYIPLGGNRKGRRRTYVNLIVTFLLAGLWHGAGWTFVMWGGLHGAGLAFERWRRRDARSQEAAADRTPPGRRMLQRAAVFAFVTLAWVFFRAETFSDAVTVLWRLVAGWGSLGSAVTWQVVALVAAGIAVQYIPRSATARFEELLSRVGWVGQAAVIALALFLIDTFGPAGAAEFLYFQF